MNLSWKTLLPFVFTLILVAALSVLFNPAPTQAQGGVTGFANLRISNFYRAQVRPVMVLTANSTINPSGTYQPISSTTALGRAGSAITVKPAGTVLTLVNIGAQTITFTETGTLVSAGNVALGANDAATFYSNGTNWYQVSASNN